MSRANPRYKRTNLPLPAPVNNVYEVIMYATIEGQITINTFYFTDGRAIGVFGPAPESELAGKFNLVYATAISNVMTTDCVVTGVKVQCVTSFLRAPYIVTYATGIPGTVAPPHEPTQVSAVMLRRTGYKGQSGRGRISWPGVPQTFVLMSSLTTAAKTTYTTLGTALLAQQTTTNETFTPSLVSRRGKAPTISFGSAPLASLGINATLGTVRRRKLGKGK